MKDSQHVVLLNVRKIYNGLPLACDCTQAGYACQEEQEIIYFGEACGAE